MSFNPMVFILIMVVIWLLITLFAVSYFILPKCWRVETIEIKSGVAKFMSFYVSDFDKEVDGLKLKVSDLYRGQRQPWKLPYYIMRGCRASLVSVYVNGGKEPETFKASEVRGNLLKLAKESTAINQAMSSTFATKNNTKLIIILLLLFIAVMLGLSFYKSGGF